MEELMFLLNEIDDSYVDFVYGILNYAEKKSSRKESLINFLKANPKAKSSDVVLFVSKQKDFIEDAAYM